MENCCHISGMSTDYVLVLDNNHVQDGNSNSTSHQVASHHRTVDCIPPPSLSTMRLGYPSINSTHAIIIDRFSFTFL